MIETLARAMYEGERGRMGVGRPWERLMVPAKSKWMLRAEDALKALETPTPGMIDAGEELIPWTRGTESRHGMATPEQIFTAMIRAASVEDKT